MTTGERPTHSPRPGGTPHWARRGVKLIAAGAAMTGLALAGSMLFAPGASHAQRSSDANWRVPPSYPKRSIIPGNEFTFCTVQYGQVRNEDLGFGWNTDYPDSGYNFMIRLEELTTIRIDRNEFGEPNQVVLRLTDPELFNYPFIFMSDAGTAGFSRAEIEALRKYLLRGGFLYVDDFWGDAAWNHWVTQISEALPPDEYPIRDIPRDHEIFDIVFHVDDVPQVPSIQHWWRSGGETTSERGWATSEPHFRGIWDKDGRLMVVMTHNTDIADGWEKEREDRRYFQEFSVKKAYPFGINIVVYALTH